MSKAPPTISQFLAANALLQTFAPTDLTWYVAGAEHVEIAPGIGQVHHMAGRQSVMPRVDTTYHLRARTRFGITATATATVRVTKVPPTLEVEVIPDFLSSPGPVEVRWKAGALAEKVFIDGVEASSTQGAVTHHPRRDTQWDIRAVSYFGVAAHETAKLTVSRAPAILRYLSATPPVVLAGMETEVRWKFDGAENCTIEPTGTTLAPEGRLFLRPELGVEYSLAVKTAFGVETRHPVPVSALAPTTLWVERQTNLRCDGSPGGVTASASGAKWTSRKHTELRESTSSCHLNQSELGPSTRLRALTPRRAPTPLRRGPCREEE